MYAKVVTFQVRQGKHDDAVRIFKEVVIPSAKKQKGFKGGTLLTDPDTGKGISIGFWESEEDIRASESSGFYREWISRFGEIFTIPPSRAIYQVANFENLFVK